MRHASHDHKMKYEFQDVNLKRDFLFNKSDFTWNLSGKENSEIFTFCSKCLKGPLKMISRSLRGPTKVTRCP